MGAGASTQVHTITESTRPSGIEDKSDDSTHILKNKKEPKNTPNLLAKTPKMAQSIDNVQQLEKMLAESESRRLDLEDRIEGLEEMVREMTAVTEVAEVSPGAAVSCEQVTQLELRCQQLQDEITQLKLKHKRRLKKLRAELTEVKQESSILHFEMKAEHDKLLEENMQLQNKLHTYEKDGAVQNDGHQRMDLIVELSGQVSEQSEEIERLEKVIEEKNRVIERLEQTQASLTSATATADGQTHSAHPVANRQTRVTDAVTDGLTSASESCESLKSKCQANGADRLMSSKTYGLSSYCEDDYNFPERGLKYEGRWQSSSEQNKDERKSGRKKDKGEGKNKLETSVYEGEEKYSFSNSVLKPYKGRWQSSNELSDKEKKSERKTDRKKKELETNTSPNTDNYSFPEPVLDKQETRRKYDSESNDAQRQHERRKKTEVDLAKTNGMRLVAEKESNGYPKHHIVSDSKESTGYPLHQFMSDSDSDLSIDGEFSVTKVHSAPPLYTGHQHGRGPNKARHKRRALEKQDKPQTTLIPVRCFEEDDLFSDEFGSEVKSKIS